jgi:hypothetical protein
MNVDSQSRASAAGGQQSWTNWTKEHIGFCETDDGVLFLDLRRSRYMGISKEDGDALSSALLEGPRSITDDMTDRGNGVLNTLVAHGVLDPTRRTRVAPRTELADASDCIGLEEIVLPAAGIDGHHVLAFLYACAMTHCRLRFRSLHAIVQDIKAKRDCAAAAGRVGSGERRRMRDLVVCFRRIRPFVYTAREACLFDSLALIYFLARFDLFPTWVIGVKTRPFAAHSWVQHDALVLNDLPETVRAFTPILVL